MSAAIFPFLVGFLSGGGLVALALHALVLRWLFAEARRRRATPPPPGGQP